MRYQPPPTSALPSRLPAGSSALLAAPLAVAGAALLAAWMWRRSQRARGGAWLREAVAGYELDPSRHELAAFIRETLIGLGKHDVRRLLGAPSAAASGGMIVSRPEPRGQTAAGRWYYRLSQAPRQDDPGTALVVDFDASDRAVDAAFLVNPVQKSG